MIVKTSFQRPFGRHWLPFLAIFVVKLSDPTIVLGCRRDPSSCCFQSSVLCWGISCTKCLVCWPTPGNIWRAVRSAVWSSGRLHLAAAASSLVYTTHRSVHLTLLSHSISSVELSAISVLLSSGWSWPFSLNQLSWALVAFQRPPYLCCWVQDGVDHSLRLNDPDLQGSIYQVRHIWPLRYNLVTATDTMYTISCISSGYYPLLNIHFRKKGLTATTMVWWHTRSWAKRSDSLVSTQLRQNCRCSYRWFDISESL